MLRKNAALHRLFKPMNTKQLTINIDDIERAPNKTLQINFEEFIEGVKSKQPIKANLTIEALDGFIKVSGQVRGQTLIECDLCLEEFEYDLDFEIDELFAKNVLLEDAEQSGQEVELKDGQFVTDLKGSDSIDISDLLYQSVILDFPNKKVCGINCNGGDIFIREEEAPNDLDPRMAIFKNIAIQKADKK